MDALDRAAKHYQELDLIDFYTCLLTIGEALRSVGESSGAEGILARITRDLCDEKWTEPQAMNDPRRADSAVARRFVG